MPSDPLPAATERGLRAEVLALKRRRARGHLPLRVSAGQPGGDDGIGDDTDGWVARFDPEPGSGWDHHTRTEVASALGNKLCDRVAEPLLWISRSGDLELCPTDLAWLAAGRAAWAELGWAPSFALVTRSGWLHQPSGRLRRWKRLRVH